METSLTLCIIAALAVFFLLCSVALLYALNAQAKAYQAEVRRINKLLGAYMHTSKDRAN